MNNEMELATGHPRFIASAESSAITKLLQDKEVGRIVTYEEIIAVTGFSVDSGIEPVRGYLQTARRNLQREKKMVFEVVVGVGLKRLKDSEIVDCSKAKMDHVRRSARRAAKTLACADFSNLTPPEKNEALCLQAQMGAVTLASSLSAQHTIEQKLQQGKKLEIGNVINFFKEAA